MLDYLIQLVERLRHWGYVVVFVIILLECQAGLGVFMPGESLVLVTGFLASQGVLDLDALIVVIACAAILGDTIGYELGRKLGTRWLLRHGRWAGVRESQLQRIDGFFQRHGGKAAFSAHFMHLLRSPVPFVAGASRMRYWLFLVFNTLGCIVWAGAFASLGYLVGASWRVAEKWIGRGSAVISGLIALALALAWLWRWIVRHEREIREQCEALLEHPRVMRFREGFAPQLAWLQRRLSPQGYLSLHLTAGALVFIGACWLFGGITEDVLTGDPLTVVDQEVADFLHANAIPWLTRIMQAITFLGSVAFLTGASAVAALCLAWHRRWYRLLTLLLAVPGGAVLDVLLKHAFHRHRPIFENPLVTLASYSFPSGHTMGAILFYGSLAAFAVIALRGWRWKVLAVLVACFTILLIGFSRIYLGAHYLSDVIGAVAAGIAWLALCITAVETLRRRKERETAALRPVPTPGLLSNVTELPCSSMIDFTMASPRPVPAGCEPRAASAR